MDKNKIEDTIKRLMEANQKVVDRCVKEASVIFATPDSIAKYIAKEGAKRCQELTAEVTDYHPQMKANCDKLAQIRSDYAKLIRQINELCDARSQTLVSGVVKREGTVNGCLNTYRMGKTDDTTSSTHSTVSLNSLDDFVQMQITISAPLSRAEDELPYCF